MTTPQSNCLSDRPSVPPPLRHSRHGEHGTRLHRIWWGMITRCQYPTDTSYAWYGSRGITVCAEWQIFITFRDWAQANGYSNELTIDRIDNNGPYCPSNCRWASWDTQRNNTSRSRYMTAFGETMTLADWVRDPRCEVNYQTLRTRLNRGKDPEIALRRSL